MNAASIVNAGPAPVCIDHVTGMRTASKPAAATADRSAGVIVGLPHAVSPSGASRLLPKFQPKVRLPTSSAAVTNSPGTPPLPTRPPLPAPPLALGAPPLGAPPSAAPP